MENYKTKQNLFAYFSGEDKKIFTISTLPKGYEAFAFNNKNEYGVAIECDLNIKISEKFSSIFIESRLDVVEKGKNYITLCCKKENLKNHFIDVAINFLDKLNRYVIINNPIQWYEDMSKLIGNNLKTKKVYDVLGELVCLDLVYNYEKDCHWDGPNGAINDIETPHTVFEVKSTISRNSNKIHVSSKYQFKKIGTAKTLFFIIFEESNVDNALSIKKLISKLIDKGFDKDELKENIERLGFNENSSDYDKKFSIVDSRFYLVDENFPVFNIEACIQNGFISNFYTNIEAQLDLGGMKFYEELHWDENSRIFQWSR